ncbi:MAG: FAD:protein FMN transferase [Oscillospiraceae bacterium]|nr:FAD:protein FMN transferase [Oscillospiraceae bacterium]
MSGCASSGPPRQSVTFAEGFDTVGQITSYGSDSFDTDTMAVRARLAELHRLFDIYNNYDGLNNAKTVNDNAGIAPVTVPNELFELIRTGVEWHEKTDGKVNIALGPVLRLWQPFFSAGTGRPSEEELMAALEMCDIGGVVLDSEKSTVFLKHAGMSLDLGAVAKGYAAQMAVLESQGSVLLNLGGNVVSNGSPPDGREKWTLGIANPDKPEEVYRNTYIGIEAGAVVTSGDYQRFYIEDGKRFCHIIDPATAMPGTLYRSVTVTGADSGLCDILSTALFLLPQDVGGMLAQENGCEAVWILNDLSVIKTDGLP